MVVLRALNLRWINGVADDPLDLCAHGDIEFRVGTHVLVDDASGKDLSVSAAALYLLRTLSVPHTKQSPVGDHLFPCCGFAMFHLPDQEDVTICGCSNGVDFEVLHEPSGIGVAIRAEDGREWRVAWPEWREAVFGFTDVVSDFYAISSPKQPSDEEDVKGYRKFTAEWERRRGKSLGRVG